MNKHESVALDWAEQTEKDPDAGLDVQAACRRFLRDLDSGRWDWKPEEAEMIILIMETLFCHQQPQWASA